MTETLGGYGLGMQLRHLRVLSTLLLGFAIAQAGLGSGYLDGFDWLLIAHATNAFAVLVLTVLTAVIGFAYRRAGGPSWVFYFPFILVIVVATQMTLGFAGIRGGHVFLGVLFLCAVTTLCSYSWQLRPADDPATPDASEESASPA